MRIAQVAPLYESVPPRLYGGTERIVSYLTEELVRKGHEVTLFASGDSMTSAELVAPCASAIRLNPSIVDAIPYHVMLLDQLLERADEFDIVHFHMDLLHLPLAQRLLGPNLTTLHGRLDLPDLRPFYRTFCDAQLVSISNSQRAPMPPVNWAGTVYHGLPPALLPPRPAGDEGYLAFLGRISPEKGPDRAIEIATRAGLPLRIAAKVDKADREFWETEIKPMVEASPNVEFVGEVNELEKAEFLGKAKALLFPINWPEPFGLVMIEAMSCGTPVVAYRCGSVEEVIDDGLSGFIVDDAEGAVRAVQRLGELDRSEVRRVFERRFTAERMADDYVRLYTALVEREQDGTPMFPPRLDGELQPSI